MCLYRAMLYGSAHRNTCEGLTLFHGSANNNQATMLHGSAQHYSNIVRSAWQWIPRTVVECEDFDGSAPKYQST